MISALPCGLSVQMVINYAAGRQDFCEQRGVEIKRSDGKIVRFGIGPTETRLPFSHEIGGGTTTGKQQEAVLAMLIDQRAEPCSEIRKVEETAADFEDDGGHDTSHNEDTQG